MRETENNITENQKQEELQEKYLKSLDQLEEGQIVEGTVIECSSEYVFLDIGYKSEGKIPVNEFKVKPSIGDTVNVMLLKKEDKSGEIVISKKKADLNSFWSVLSNAADNNEALEGKIVKSLKGGFEVELEHGIKAFNPISLIDVRRVEDQEEYVGIKSKFIIQNYIKGKNPKIVVSRRKWLEKEISGKKEAFFANTKVGDTVEGEVKSFTSFGAFIDLGGFDGLLHINDMSWGHVNRPKDYVKKNDKIKLKVVNIDPETQKINLSLKDFSDNPWNNFESKYNVDDIVKAKVTKLTDFGAFLELEDGIEGLVHISELSWIKRINHPKEVLNIGDEVQVKVLSFDLENKKISLGLKQVLPNPWDDIIEKYPKGTRIKRKIVKVTNSGAFIEIEDGINGFLNVDDISWTKKIKNPSSALKKDEEIEVVVLNIDKDNSRIKLGIKQLSDNPWIALKEAHPKGSTIEGEITSITDFGLFVKVTDSIDGLINKNNILSHKPAEDENALEKYKVGDKVKAVISDIDIKRQKLSLSIRDYVRKVQKKEISKYIHDDSDEDKATLGDFLKEKDN